MWREETAARVSSYLTPGANQGCRVLLTDLCATDSVRCLHPCFSVSLGSSARCVALKRSSSAQASRSLVHKRRALGPQQWSGVLVTTGSSPARQLGSLSLVATVLWLRSRNRLRETVQWLLTGRGGHLLSTASRGRRDRRAARTPTGRMSWAPGTDAPRLHLLSTADRTGGDGSPLVGSTDSGGPLSPSDRAVGQAGRSR